MTGIVLEAKGLVKRFGDLTAVNDLSLAVQQGEILGFLGPNGAGKTTTINMLCGICCPDAGSVTINSEPMAGNTARIRSRLGVCPQEVVIWQNLTCSEQLIFMAHMYSVDPTTARNRSQKLLSDLNLEGKSNKLARTLSGGMKRRLNLALALIHDPEILILDEPEAGLDPQSRVLVRDYIRALAPRKTVILTTHNMDEADRLSDRVAVIDHGRLLVLDTPEALKHRVGSGDVLEISLCEEDGNKARIALLAFGDRISLEMFNNTLLIRGLDIVSVLPDILNSLKSGGIECREVHLRQNTLEDVFIQLTGRRLRE